MDFVFREKDLSEVTTRLTTFSVKEHPVLIYFLTYLTDSVPQVASLLFVSVLLPFGSKTSSS